MNFTQTNNTDFPVLSLSAPKKRRQSFAPVVGKTEANLPTTCFSLPVPGQGLQINHSKANPLLIKNGVMTDVNTGIKHPLPVPKAQVPQSDDDDGFVKVKKVLQAKSQLMCSMLSRQHLLTHFNWIRETHLLKLFTSTLRNLLVQKQ